MEGTIRKLLNLFNNPRAIAALEQKGKEKKEEKK